MGLYFFYPLDLLCKRQKSVISHLQYPYLKSDSQCATPQLPKVIAIRLSFGACKGGNPPLIPLWNQGKRDKNISFSLIEKQNLLEVKNEKN